MLSRKQLQFFSLLSVMIAALAAFNFAGGSEAAELGTLTLINSNGDGTAFVYNVNGPVTPSGQITVTDGTSQELVSTVNFGVQVSIFQVAQTGYDLAITCVDGNGNDLSQEDPNAPDFHNFAAIGSNGMSIKVRPDDELVCTFTNTNIAGSIKVIADNLNPELGDVFSFNGTNILSSTFTLENGGEYFQSPVNPGNYTIRQTILDGYVIDVECVGGDATILTNFVSENGATMHVDAGEDIVCTFTNDYVGANITINNVIAGGDATEINYADVSFSNIPLGNGTTGFTLADGESLTVSDKRPGTSTIFAPAIPGYVIDFDCTTTLGSTITLGDRSIAMDIVAEDQIVCTNTYNYVAGTITIKNITTSAGVPIANVLPFTYTTSFGNLSVDSNDEYVEPIVMPNQEKFIFQPLQDGYDLTISCTGTADPDAIRVSGNGAFITLADNEDVVCEYVNVDSNPVPPTPVNLLTNSDFELGRDGTWREQSTWGFDLVVHESAYGGTVPPQSGEHLAWLGGANWENSYISQEFTLPAGENATVGFSYWVESRDWCGYDWGAVYIYDGSSFYRIWTQPLCLGAETNGWADAEIELGSEFAGQTVRVLFKAKNDSVYHSSMYVDDVEVSSEAGRAAISINPIDVRSVDSDNEEEITDNDLDAIANGVDKPEREENNRDYEDHVINDKAPEGTTAVALSSANVQDGGTSSVMLILSLVATILVATATLVSARRRAM